MQRGLLILLAFLLAACENTTFRSSVPTYFVRFSIDTKTGPFVHFTPEAQNDHVILTQDGYYYNGKWVAARGATDAFGYGGVIVYVGMSGYVAFDLACPYCAARGSCQPCDIDGIFAVCPECGERYELASGLAAPQQGIAHECLRQYKILVSDRKLTVTQ